MFSVEIVLITTPRYHRKFWWLPRTECQKMMDEFARVLPALIAGRAGDLYLNPIPTESGVQVTYCKSRKQKATTDMRMLIHFSTSGGLDESQRSMARHFAKKIFLDWFREKGYDHPRNIVVDCCWDPSHGFSVIDGVESEW